MSASSEIHFFRLGDDPAAWRLHSTRRRYSRSMLAGGHFPGSRLIRRNPELGSQLSSHERLAANPARRRACAGIRIAPRRVSAEPTVLARPIGRKKSCFTSPVRRGRAPKGIAARLRKRLILPTESYTFSPHQMMTLWQCIRARMGVDEDSIADQITPIEFRLTLYACRHSVVVLNPD